MAAISRRSAGIDLSRGAIAAAALFLACCAALAALRAGTDGERPSPGRAQAAALAAPEVRAELAGGYTRVRTMALDARTVRVSFFDGPRALAEAAVGPGGRVRAVIAHDPGRARTGSDVGQRPAVLAGLALLFLLATVRLPLARRANLDALALAGAAIPIVLLNERYLEWSAVAGALLLAYLGWRCLRVAAGRAGPAAPARPLWGSLPSRVRWALGAGAAVALVLLSVPGGLVSDVGLASLAGATEILDGRAPYGNLAVDGLVHGDTYPLLAYAAYVPAALAGPVRDAFDGLEGALFVATGAALLAAIALGRAAGPRLAVAFLAFAPVMVASSSGSNDAVAAAALAGALAWAGGAAASSGWVAAAGWVKLAPLALVPLWVAARRGRGAGRALAAAAAVTAVAGAALVALGGWGALAEMAEALRFQSERGSPMSPWAVVDLPAAQIAFQAAVITGLALGAVRLWRDRSLARDPVRLAALGAAVLVGIQLAANHWTPTYLAWAFPLLAVALLSDRARGQGPPGGA